MQMRFRFGRAKYIEKDLFHRYSSGAHSCALHGSKNRTCAAFDVTDSGLLDSLASVITIGIMILNSSSGTLNCVHTEPVQAEGRPTCFASPRVGQAE